MTCSLICHDENHNGDYSPNGCGNPACWKYERREPPQSPSPPAMPRRSSGCRCPWMTFPGETQWEYKSVHHQELAQYGGLGWEVCAALTGDVLLVKRKTHEVPPYAQV